MTKLVLIITQLALIWLFQANGSCPPMYYRNQWGASPPHNRTLMRTTPVPNVVIHHSATRTCTSPPDCMAIIKSFQTNHMTDRGWDDIAYSFLIGGDGNLYEGRGWGVEVQGTQPPEWNYLGYTFCIVGTFEGDLPTEQQMTVVRQLVECAAEEGHTSGNYTLRGHRDVYADTACPGDALYNEIQSWPNYNTTEYSSP